MWSDDVGLDGDDSVDAEGLDESRLRAIGPIASRGWYRVMADFTDELSDTSAQAELSVALQGRGAFHRFRDVLHQRHPELVGPLRAYEQTRGHHLAVDWLSSEGLVDPDVATDFIRAHPTPFRSMIPLRCQVDPQALDQSALMPACACRSRRCWVE